QGRRHDEQIAALIEQGREHDRRLAELTKQIAELTEQVRENSEQIAALIEQGRRHDERIEQAMQGLDRVYGWALENQYRDRPFAYFSRIVRRARWISGDKLEDMLDEAVKAGRISETERNEIIWADLVIRGIRQGQPTWIVVEVSRTIGYEDINRALERRDLLARCVDAPVVAAVAGEYCAEEVLEKALAHGVWVVLNGRTYSPEVRREESNI
ncbi:MAG: hypothetical protein NZ781_10320, partial [Armatimonadetes bacterium]|nr:hypothetical protein [Armatimonadota bacterium]